MTRTIKKSQLRQNLFDHIFVIWAIYYLLFILSTFGRLFNDITLISWFVTSIVFIGLVFVLLLTDFTKTDFLIVFLLLLLGLINAYYTRNLTRFIMFLFLCGTKSVDITITTKKVLHSVTTVSVFVVFFALIGLIQNKSSVGLSFWDNRVYLGFNHPNYCGAIILNLILLVIINMKGNLKLRDYLFILCLEFVNLIGPKSKTSLILGVFSVVTVLILSKITPHMKKKILSKVKYLPFVLAGLSVLVVYFYYMNTAWSLLLNTLLSTRIEQMAYFWNNYGITLFGQVLENVSSSQSSTLLQMRGLDNGYLYMLLGEGIMFTLFFIAVSIRSVIWYVKFREYSSVLVLTVILIWGLMETTMFRIEMNYLLLLFSNGLFALSKGVDYVKHKKELVLSNGV